ncbi:IclR family transcriptional regulator [Tenuibacillus multivorans]|uniref:Glycerol operon regulatory protein n=1 Tax=Tenuibacillus multivorans TaxID=237069 RepID=A0A1H0DI49_9BACI|nr:IclR family transcriptional regulator [Tenuibacillus multivorans]GEL76547.1 putative HTH-type transcriptional regulator YagI [Tenuibacillus multivorans]SDN69691.1 DNA-binding transcriptional regulator, IclR family [Tenuibacillus multivorans]
MNQSVLKALQLLDLFDEQHPELTLKEISELSRLPKPTAYRLLQALEMRGFLMKTDEQDPRYRLGLKLLGLGQLVSDQLDLRQMARPLMEGLAYTINEAVHLVVVDGHQATYIEKVDSQRALRLFTKVGQSVPLFIGSGPKLLLAYMPEEERLEVLEKHDMYSMTEEKPIDKATLWDELVMIRQKGYALSISEQDLDTTGISFPILDYQGQVLAALTVSGLSSRFEGDNLTFINKETKIAANEISKRLGYSTAKKGVH